MTKKKKNKPTEDLPENSLEITGERTVKYTEFDVEMSESLRQSIIKFALKEIVHDEDALLNYGFVKALENGIKELEKEEKS